MNRLYSIVCIMCLLVVYTNGYGQLEQERTTGSESLLENLAEKLEEEDEDETLVEQLVWLRKHPLNINEVDADELALLMKLSAIQIDQFLKYRKHLGKFISLYELQAVPSWNVELINDLVPYLTMGNDQSFANEIGQRVKSGEHILLLRSTQVLEKAKGFFIKEDSLNRYYGSPQKIYFRYKYSYKNLLQYGWLGEKDAGENFFKGNQRYGFDFYSGHIFIRKLGIIKALALGDFTVSMGQGLLLWQGMGISKGSEVLQIKRQSPVFKPYHSAGEFNFMRGGAVTLYDQGKWEASAFLSNRKLDASVESEGEVNYISSINTSGMHRTPNELSKKGNVHLWTTGTVVKYKGQSWASSINMVHYQYADTIRKRAEPYNFYAAKGRRFTNVSVDYQYTIQNMHLFGEIAVDKNWNRGILGGLLISLDKHLDAAFLYRNLPPGFQSIYGNAFTENSLPINENGLYTGVGMNLGRGLSAAGYADISSFSWLKYRINKPSYNKDYLLQLTYKPDKKTEVYVRYRVQNKNLNNSESEQPLQPVMIVLQRNLRLNVATEISRNLSFRSRTEINWYKGATGKAEQGYLWFADLLYKPMSVTWSGNARVAYFNTDTYNSRVYAYENDVLYTSTISPLYSNGTRAYLNVRKIVLLHQSAVKRTLQIYFRLAKTLYSKPTIGTGIEEIQGFRKSEIKIQVVYL